MLRSPPGGLTGPFRRSSDVGLECPAEAAYSSSMDDTPHLAPAAPPADDAEPEFAPAGAPPHVAVAPGVLDQDHIVVRADDDTDEDYAARSRVFAAALAFARDG